MDCPSTFNGILRRPLLWNFKVVTFIYHQKMKFPTPTRCGEVRGSLRESHNYYNQAIEIACKGKTKPKDKLEQAIKINRIKPQPGPVGDNIDPRVQEEYTYNRPVETLSKNIDVFAWTHADMIGVSPEVICHALNINSEIKPVCQKRRAMDIERYVAFKLEVGKLFSIGLIREAHYRSWVTNPIFVKKLNGNWRTCVGFMDLNKACPKDNFLSPRINQLVDATSEHELLSFMDAYSGCN
ncbi:uncharacterized protein LOC116120428 [Pistacia vera]|uniref:uncharacterized protein LOC116120428 n=1 Tax=Pistacia vera TaxID=55513 RepID=UPI001263AEAA|nr:uncharacterized protein LOC116120428 [Pistacia vera]